MESRSRDIEGVLKSGNPGHSAFDHFSIFCIRLNTHRAPTGQQIEVCNFSHYREIEGVPKCKSGSCDLGHAPFVT